MHAQEICDEVMEDVDLDALVNVLIRSKDECVGDNGDQIASLRTIMCEDFCRKSRDNELFDGAGDWWWFQKEPEEVPAEEYMD